MRNLWILIILSLFSNYVLAQQVATPTTIQHVYRCTSFLYSDVHSRSIITKKFFGALAWSTNSEMEEYLGLIYLYPITVNFNWDTTSFPSKPMISLKEYYGYFGSLGAIELTSEGTTILEFRYPETNDFVRVECEEIPL